MADNGQPTLYLDWGGDFKVNQNGGLELATGWTEVSQRIIRRLLTNPRFFTSAGEPVAPGYIYHTDFGQGLRRRVGDVYTQPEQKQIQQSVNKGVMVDQGVDASKPPTVKFKELSPHLFVLEIGVVLKTKEVGVITIGYKADGSA